MTTSKQFPPAGLGKIVTHNFEVFKAHLATEKEVEKTRLELLDEDELVPFTMTGPCSIKSLKSMEFKINSSMGGIFHDLHTGL